MKTIDPGDEVRDSDTIVLAAPISQRDIRALSVVADGRDEPLRLAETETTLKVFRVLKGRVESQEIRFYYYDARGYPLIGAPRGASGGTGSKGVFFLRKQPEGIYRSTVDVYRPDISTPWMLEVPDLEGCTSASECIARLLLTYHSSDDASVFSYHLMMNVATSRQLTGYVETFQLLRRLAEVGQPEVVRQRACTELAQGYELLFPAQCFSSLAGGSEQDHATRAGRLREALRQGGIPWIKSEIGTTDDRGVTRYLEILSESPDEATRSVARRLLKDSR